MKDIEFAVNETGINEDILVIAGDNLIDFSMSEFTHFSADKGCASFLLLHYAFDMPGKKYDIGDLKSYEYANMVFGEIGKI